MKKFLSAIALLLATALPSFAQSPLTQSWIETVAGAPPAVLVGQTASSSTATGAFVSSTGGSLAAGSYRIGVTFFGCSNTETPLSVDTATTSVAVLTGATSTLTVQAPISSGGVGTICGWRPYVGLSGGASGAEALVTPTALLCTLSATSTPSCSLNSPATFVSTTFAAGSGGPASPGTLLTYPTANAANQALFENSTALSHVISWVVSGTAPSACAFQLQTGAATGSLANVGQSITCTSSGTYAIPYVTPNAFSSINLSSFTAGGVTTSVTFYMTTLPYINPYYWGNAAPTSACTAGMGEYMNTATTTTAWYSCASGTWTSVTLP